MSKIRINSLKVKNYRSFGSERQEFKFPGEDYKKPVAVIGYNNVWKTTLINTILYWLQVNFVSKDTFSINDFHNKEINNVPEILLEVDSSIENKFDWKKAILKWFHKLIIQTDWQEIEGSKIQSYNSLNQLQKYNWGPYVDDENYQAFWATRYFSIFYINFHKIKDEISTKKSTWWNLSSFLAKHIDKIVKSDNEMNDKKIVFSEMIKSDTKFMLENSKLNTFIEKIKSNYAKNLRNNLCEIEFWLPDYEDIFLQMLFKIWLNWEKEKLLPIDHFWDWYISMFVMAVIQAIAEEQIQDKCLFIFEEPESFLHENHQEYFYKMVLCELAKNHQVIYTTHSDKMIDMFDTRWIIRLELENNNTIKKYNNIVDFSPLLEDVKSFSNDEIETMKKDYYNDYIKNIEPNLNKILFSRKVLLVEWPNDLMVYNYVIEKKLKELWNDESFAKSYLNFYNIAIIPHHWKSTALLLIKICKHFWIDYFIINDLDFDDNNLFWKLSLYENEINLKAWNEYTQLYFDKKWMLTINWKLINEAWKDNIHFNVSKLEKVINYNSDDKNAVKIWKHINENLFDISDRLFPEKLKLFLELE